MREVRGGQESCPVHQGLLCEAVDLCSRQSCLKALKGFPRSHTFGNMKAQRSQMT